MSVTFAPTIAADAAYRITCVCEAHNDGLIYADHSAAYAALSGVTSTCTDPYCETLYITPAVEGPSLNVSNLNAVDLLDLLGIGVGDDFEDRCVGTMKAADLLGRVLLAQALTPADAGVASYAEGNVIHCGRPAGYYEDRLAILQDIALWANTRGLTITWG
jgi:hypothetical protein